MTEDKIISSLYWNLKRENNSGSIADAIRTHSQVCGLIAYIFDVHPDTIARIVHLEECEK